MKKLLQKIASLFRSLQPEFKLSVVTLICKKTDPWTLNTCYLQMFHHKILTPFLYLQLWLSLGMVPGL